MHRWCLPLAVAGQHLRAHRPLGGYTSHTLPLTPPSLAGTQLQPALSAAPFNWLAHRPMMPANPLVLCPCLLTDTMQTLQSRS